MKKLSLLLENVKKGNALANINTVEAFKKHVHEQLSSKDTYDKDTVEQLTESLLTENRNDIQSALVGFDAFLQG